MVLTAEKAMKRKSMLRLYPVSAAAWEEEEIRSSAIEREERRRRRDVDSLRRGRRLFR